MSHPEKLVTGLGSQMENWVRSSVHSHFINGAVIPIGNETLPVMNPAADTILCHIASGKAEDVNAAVESARQAFVLWRQKTPAERAAVLNDLADVVEQHQDELSLLESLNTGKPKSVSDAEIETIGDVIRFHAGASRALMAPAPNRYTPGHLSILHREPVGVVGAITPWNYPLLTAIFKIAGALAMGNTMVLKPSELTPLTTLRFMEISSEVLPPGVLNVVLGTGEAIGTAISGHPDIDLVSLTGSVASGVKVVTNSAATLKPTHLELGGKAPVIVFDDADIDAVCEAVRMAGFWNSGQECGAATRVLASAAIAEELAGKLVAAAASIRVGKADEGDNIEMGPLISRQQLDAVSAMVERARSDGATIATGGEIMDRDGYFYPPTVITNAPPGSEITTREIFGPVVTIETFEGEAEATQMGNSVDYGLSASVWTNDIGRAMRVSDQLDFGTVWINTHLVLAAEMPWGGFGASGGSRELSILGLEDFSRTKHVMIATGEAP